MPTAPASARFITLEGGEGVGKSTQARHLAERLRALGREVVVTREPGGSPFAEAVRRLILDPATPPHSALAEALLFSAARADHVEAVIRPALARGAWVICDRFTDSTRVYQGAAGGLASPTLATLEHIVVADTVPDLTLVLDLPEAVGLARAAHRDTARPADPYQQRTEAFHAALRAGFRDLAASTPARCVLIDAHGTPDVVADAIWRTVLSRLGAP